MLAGRTRRLSEKLPKKKYCPLCGSLLKPGEPILAEMDKSAKPIKVYIKGCNNCYRNYQLPEKSLEVVDYGNIINQ